MKCSGRHVGRKFLICGLFLAALSSMSLLYLHHWGSSPLMGPMKTPLRGCLDQIPGRCWPQVVILLWTWHPFLTDTINNCSEMLGLPADCIITTDNDQYHIANGVLVHYDNVYGGPEMLPQGPRPRFQHWIWFNMVPPSQTPNLTLLDGLFNLTMSFRRDSDIVTPFGWLTALSRPYNYAIPPKSKMVACIWNKWRLGSNQAKYYIQLKTYLPVDLFRSQEKDVANLSQYKFYLAFEDDDSEDYITEELWRYALGAGSVPVVLGPPRENYERYLPPEAFIHVEDFPSVQQLAAFLYELDQNQTHYESYFQWRRWWTASVETSLASRLCRACRVVQEKSASFQRSWNLSQWFK